MLYMTPTTRLTKKVKFNEYKMAGPKYMRTWLTSSLILFIKSPVSFAL